MMMMMMMMMLLLLLLLLWLTEHSFSLCNSFRHLLVPCSVEIAAPPTPPN
jgi:hypothetical protein